MNELTTWYNSMDPTLRVFWGAAIFSSVIFVIQTALSFIGIGDYGDVGGADVDFDASLSTDTDSLDDAGSMHLLSIRNVIYFLLGFGWAGVCLWNTIPQRPLLIAAAVLVGLLFVGIFLFLFRQMMKLQHNGAFDINDAVGTVCDVYLRIPAEGEGQVQVSFHGSVQELPARSTGQPIATGRKVRVLQVIDRRVLVVEEVHP